MKDSFSDRILHWIIVILLILICVITFFPLYYVALVSVTDSTYYVSVSGKVFFPTHLSLESFRYLFSTDAIPRSMVVTAMITVVGTVLSILINASLSYAISRKRLFGRKVILIFILFTMIFSPGLIPNYLLVQNLRLIDSLWALVLPALINGWNVILMRNFFNSIPESLEEAAMIDGCNDLEIFFRIILPLSLASIAAFSLFYAVGYWNTFLPAVYYINKPELWPLQVIVRNLLDVASSVASPEAQVEMDVTTPSEMLQSAAVIVAVLPILVVYPFLQKYFTKGVMLGSVKE